MEQGGAQAMAGPERGDRRARGARALGFSHRAFLLVWLALVILAAAGPFPLPAGAQPAPARLEVEGEATYDPQNRWLTATRVRFQQGGVTVASEGLEVDLARQKAVFSGQVRLETEGGSWEGERLTYELETGRFTLNDGSAEVRPPGVQGAFYLQVPTAAGTASRIELADALLTTCSDPSGAEYHLRARAVEIEPGRRMVLHHVVYVEGSIPLFYWPRLTVSLDPAEELGTSPFQPPEFGWTEEDGWYLRGTYYYDTRPERLGAVHAGYHQYSGWGLGVTQQLPLGPAAGMVGVDWLQNPPSEAKGRDVAEPRYRLQARLDLPSDPEAPFRASYQAAYWELRPDAGVERGDWSLEHDLSLSAAAGGGTASLAVHQERGLEGGGPIRREGADLTARQELGPLTLRAGSQGRRWETASGVREYVGYQGEAGARWGPWDAALRAGWTLHPDLLTYEGTGGWTRFGRSPEGEVGYTLPDALWPGPLKGTRLRLSTQLGRYAEERADGTATGWIGATHLEARSSGTRVPLGAGFALGGSAWGGGWWYETGEALQYAGGSLALQYRPDGPFTGELGYTLGRRWGAAEAPFELHDEAFTERRTAELSVELDTRPLRVGAFASYDVLEERMDDLVGLVELRPGERLQVGAAAHYDVPDQTWSRYDARVALGLSDRWWLEGAATYTAQPAEGEDPLAGRVSFSYTSDCRTVSLRVDLAERALWLEYRLHAFPSASLRFGQEVEDETLFDLPDMKAVAREVRS